MVWNIRKCMYYHMKIRQNMLPQLCHFKFKNVQLSIKILVHIYVIAENR